MKSSRRDFLAMITAASGAFVAPKGMYAALSPDRKLRFGVVSDVHIAGVNAYFDGLCARCGMVIPSERKSA